MSLKCPAINYNEHLFVGACSAQEDWGPLLAILRKLGLSSSMLGPENTILVGLVALEITQPILAGLGDLQACTLQCFEYHV